MPERCVSGLSQGWPDFGDMGKFSGLPLVAVPVMWLLLIATAYAEETGWRGFATHSLLETRSLVWTGVVVGLLWARWHVPSMFVIENYRQMGLAIARIFAVGVVSGSILPAWLYRGSGGSVLVVALWHACYNLVCGTAAASGLPAAIVSTAVIVWAVVIIAAEVLPRQQNALKRLSPASI